MKTQLSFSRRIFLIAMVAIGAGTLNPLIAQIPAAMEKDMDNLNAMVYEALQVIDTESETEALKQLAALKPNIEAKAKAFEARWEGTELSNEDEIALGKKMLEKQLYKDLYALMGDPAFISKIETSRPLNQEYQILLRYLDEEGEEQISDSPASLEVGSLTFTVQGAVPYSGSYTVKSAAEQAYAHIDENNLFAVAMESTLNGGEFQFVILAEEARTGEQEWTMESQIIIQSWDRAQHEVIQLSTYYYEGSIHFTQIEGVGGKVTGTFQGKFFDDTHVTDQPVLVSGSFSVTRIKNVY